MAATCPHLKRQKPATDFRWVSAEWLHRDEAGNALMTRLSAFLTMTCFLIGQHLSVSDIGRRDALDLIDGIADVAHRSWPVVSMPIFTAFSDGPWAEGIIEANAMADLPKPGGETKRDRVLTDDELKAVWKSCRQSWLAIWPRNPIADPDGARREEIGALRWGEIDVDGAQIKLEGSRTKSGHPHTIPLSTRASDVLSVRHPAH